MEDRGTLPITNFQFSNDVLPKRGDLGFLSIRGFTIPTTSGRRLIPSHRDSGNSACSRCIKRLSYYLKIWWVMSRNSFLMVLNQKKILAIFLAGKIIRFIFYTGFIYFTVRGANDLAGYNATQAVFFLVSFAVVDTTAQFFFREVYRFRPLLVSGDFDLVLTKPMSALFRVLLGGADVIDLVTIPPLCIAAFYVGRMLSPGLNDVLIYLVLIFSGLLIAAAFHIAVIAMGIITLEIDHTVMIYRDLSNMGRFPVDIYGKPLGAILTYLIPIAVMMTFPAKGLMGILGTGGIFTSLIIAVGLLFLSLRFWNFALKRYTSASS